MNSVTRIDENKPELENIKLEFVYADKSFQSPIGKWYIHGSSRANCLVTIALAQDDRANFAKFVNDLQPYLRDKLVHHIQKQPYKNPYHFEQIYYLTIYMKSKMEIYAKRLQESELFKSIFKHSVGNNDNQVNVYTDIQQVYESYVQLSRQSGYALAVPEIDKETKTSLDIHEKQIENELMNNLKMDFESLLLGENETPQKLFAKFRQLYIRHYEAITGTLEKNANNIIKWSIFQYASIKNGISVDYVVSRIDFLSKVVESLTAFYYARFLGDKVVVAENDWHNFKSTDEHKLIHPLRKILRDLKETAMSRILPNDKQEMSIASSIKDFKSKEAITSFYS